MRRRSPNKPKQVAEMAHREGDQRSIEGKSAVRLNAAKDGLFAKELVLKQAAERQEDFDNMKNEFWDCIQPQNAIEERAVVDAIHNRWWLERVCRAQIDRSQMAS